MVPMAPDTSRAKHKLFLPINRKRKLNNFLRKRIFSAACIANMWQKINNFLKIEEKRVAGRYTNM